MPLCSGDEPELGNGNGNGNGNDGATTNDLFDRRTTLDHWVDIEARKQHSANISSELGLKLAKQNSGLGDDEWHDEEDAAFGSVPDVSIGSDASSDEDAEEVSGVEQSVTGKLTPTLPAEPTRGGETLGAGRLPPSSPSRLAASLSEARRSEMALGPRKSTFMPKQSTWLQEETHDPSAQDAPVLRLMGVSAYFRVKGKKGRGGVRALDDVWVIPSRPFVVQWGDTMTLCACAPLSPDGLAGAHAHKVKKCT